MSVFVWVNSEREILNLLPWSRWLSKELNQKLIILCYGGAYGPPAITEVDKNTLSNAPIKVKLVQILVNAPVTGVPQVP